MDADPLIVTTPADPAPVEPALAAPAPARATSPKPAQLKPVWRNAAILGGIAFLAGLGVMAFILHNYAGWFAPKPVATVTLPLATTAGGKQTPVVIVPGNSGTAAPAIDLDALSAREKDLSTRLA